MKNPKHTYSNKKKKIIQKLLYPMCMLGGPTKTAADKRESSIRSGNFPEMTTPLCTSAHRDSNVCKELLSPLVSGLPSELAVSSSATFACAHEGSLDTLNLKLAGMSAATYNKHNSPPSCV
jgi:hypothetical protein